MHDSVNRFLIRVCWYMGVFWGLAGAILIGASDCIARVTSRRVPSCLLIGAIMLLSTLVITGWLAVTGDWPAWHAYGWLASAVSGTLNLLVLFLLYKALARGPVSVASPSASVFSVILVMLNALSGEPWSAWQAVAIVLVFAGIFMLSRRTDATGVDRHYSDQWLRVTAAYGLAAAFAVSLRMFLAQEAGDTLGPVEALFLNRFFALLGCTIWSVIWFVRGGRWRIEKSTTLYLVLAQAVFETLAFSAFLIGSAVGGRIAAAIGFSAFAAATTFFARVWLKEEIGLQRIIWICVIASGVLLAILGTPVSL